MRKTRIKAICAGIGGLACAFLCMWIGFGGSAGADVVYLKSGDTKEGRVISQDENEVVLEIARRGLKASIRIPSDQVERIEKAQTPLEEYSERLKAVPRDDAKAWSDLGLWCEEHELVDEARECFNKALKADPNCSTAGEKLGRIHVAGKWLRFDEVMAKANELVTAGRSKEATPILESAREAFRHRDSLKRREALALLCQCYERDGAWAQAQECYAELIKSYGSLTPEVAVIRVKQRLLKEHPDGMVEAPPAKPAEPSKPDLVKAVGDGVKAVGDFVAHKPAPKAPLSDPKVMDAVMRQEAEKILKDAEDMVKKADGRALSDKLLHAANPIENLQRILDAIPNLMHLPTAHSGAVTIGAADQMYAKAADRAMDADFLVRDISRPLRVTIARKRAADMDEFIAQAKNAVESDPLYIPPPPNAPPGLDAGKRLVQLNPTKDRVERFRQAVEVLEKLYALKGVILKPLSDDLHAECQKNEKDMAALEDTKKKVGALAALAEDLKEDEELEVKMQDAWAKAQAAAPARYDYAYDSFLSPDNVYHFRDRGKSWRYHCTVCMNYCEDALSQARKRRAVLAKCPEHPQTEPEVDEVKNFIVQVYNYKISIMAQYDKKGSGTGY